MQGKKKGEGRREEGGGRGGIGKGAEKVVVVVVVVVVVDLDRSNDNDDGTKRSRVVGDAGGRASDGSRGFSSPIPDAHRRSAAVETAGNLEFEFDSRDSRTVRARLAGTYLHLRETT